MTAREVVLSLISHTNVGKTTLARTILRRDVGVVLDQAHVTDETERFELYRSAAGESVVLADNPGFGDSARLLRRLRGMPDPLAWLVAQVWDRFADRALYCSQQAVRHVRQEADVVLYMANASERPQDAGYLAGELEILSWIGRPVLVLLNQIGAPADASARDADLARWKEHTSVYPVVRDVLPLDAFTRCWLQEGLLFRRIREFLPAGDRPLLDAWLARWRSEQLGHLRAALGAYARLLAGAAGDREALRADGAGEAKRALEALGARLREAFAVADERAIAAYGLAGEAAQALRVELADVALPPEKIGAWQGSVLGGAVGGALGGVAADLAVGGLSFGGGALLGGVLGVLGALGSRKLVDVVRGEQDELARWSDPFLAGLADDVLLRYLAIAHFGRGAGSFRVREHPALFREASARALAPRRAVLRDASRLAREAGPAEREPAGARAATALEAAVYAVFAELYPEAQALLAGERPAGLPPAERAT